MPAPRHGNRIELLQGTLDLLILQTLQWGPRHGYSISQAIRSVSADVLQVDTGSLYPALHRLEEAGWIKARWTTSETGRRARMYEITAGGRKQLAAEEERWKAITAAVGKILKHA